MVWRRRKNRRRHPAASGSVEADTGELELSPPGVHYVWNSDNEEFDERPSSNADENDPLRRYLDDDGRALHIPTATLPPIYVTAPTLSILLEHIGSLPFFVKDVERCTKGCEPTSGFFVCGKQVKKVSTTLQIVLQGGEVPMPNGANTARFQVRSTSFPGYFDPLPATFEWVPCVGYKRGLGGFASLLLQVYNQVSIRNLGRSGVEAVKGIEIENSELDQAIERRNVQGLDWMKRYMGHVWHQEEMGEILFPLVWRSLRWGLLRPPESFFSAEHLNAWGALTRDAVICRLEDDGVADPRHRDEPTPTRFHAIGRCRYRLRP